MRLLKRVVVVLLIVVVVAVAAGAGALVWITNRAMPQTAGTLQVAGLDAAVTVDRDAAGFAHITATTAHDLFVAQGYVHAQERMWQMEVWRRISAGRLSELFGASSLEQDRFIRTLGWRQAAERDLAALSAETRAILDAYVAGVNAWLDANRGNLGLAFVITGANPEPWTVLDTLTWGKVQAWNLAGNMSSEVFRFLADARLGDPSRTDELFATREFGPVIVPRPDIEPSPDIDPLAAEDGGTARTTAGVARRPSPPPSPALTDSQAGAWRDVASIGDDLLRLAGLDGSAGGLASDHGIGSNDWVAAPALSTTGGALLANDPHLGISMPSIWFVNGLHCATVSEACPFDVAGVSFPGVPGVVLGHNARIAWGATNAAVDVQDLVIETVDPADPTRYLGPDGASLPFAITDRADRGLRRRPGNHRGPGNRPRPHPQRRRRAAGRQPADGAALVGDPSGSRAGPDVRGDPGPEQGGRFRGLPRRPVVVRRAVPELRLRRRRRAHRLSAAGLRARSAPTPATAAIGRSRARPATGSGSTGSRSSSCRGRWTRSMAGS